MKFITQHDIQGRYQAFVLQTSLHQSFKFRCCRGRPRSPLSAAAAPVVVGKCFDEVKREQLERFSGFLAESQGQNLAVSVLYVPHSLNRVGGRPRSPPSTAAAPARVVEKGLGIKHFDAMKFTTPHDLY